MDLPSPTPLPSLPPPPPQAPASPAPPATAPRRGASSWLAMVLVGLVAALGGAALALALVDTDEHPAANPVPIVRPSDQVANTPLDVGQIVAKVQPSVVNITVAATDSLSVGTGVILSADGEVLTNAHVVSDHKDVQIRLVGETEPRHGEVIATNPRNDLALIRITNATGLTPIELALPDDIQVGDDVVAMGYALDLDGGPSVTKGIVSALGRTFATEDEVLDGLIQTDAAISSGNSGGPLVNNRGQLVGINTAVARAGPDVAANNIGFAIGLAEALPTLDSMRSGAPLGADTFLGVRIDQRRDGGQGALITEVVAGTPAANAGLQVGDIVVAVNGRAIQGRNGLIAVIRDARPGDVLTIDIERGGVHQTLQATVRERNPND